MIRIGAIKFPGDLNKSDYRCARDRPPAFCLLLCSPIPFISPILLNFNQIILLNMILGCCHFVKKINKMKQLLVLKHVYFPFAFSSVWVLHFLFLCVFIKLRLNTNNSLGLAKCAQPP